MNFDWNKLDELLAQLETTAMSWLGSSAFYIQLSVIFTAVCVAYLMAMVICNRTPLFSAEPAEGRLQGMRSHIYSMRSLVFPVLLILLLAISVDITGLWIGQSRLVQLSQSIAVVFMLYSLIQRFASNKLARRMVEWVVIPASILHIFGWLDDVTAYLDDVAIEAGNVKISAYGILRMIIFGALLFWLGRVSRETGNRIIRRQEELDVGTREVFAKLFEVLLVVVIFILLLQLMGINLTTLAVFGGALGVGLGFGLQSIASNFISGIILLLDRSLTVGDYVELEDGQAGTIRQLNMRSATLETFDGKDIMVPNERFMTSTFVNWTHKNKKQRYSLEFQVAYSTDLDLLFPLLREVVAQHPSVLSGDKVPIEERPDAEIKQFGESGIDILIEFWMEGIDDGENRVGADLLLMIWYALKEHHIQIPFPQREVTILGQGTNQKASEQ